MVKLHTMTPPGVSSIELLLNREQLANDLIATTDPVHFNLDSPCLSEDVVTLRYLRSGAIAPRDFFLAIPTFWLLDEKIPSVQFPAIQDDTARKILGNTN